MLHIVLLVLLSARKELYMVVTLFLNLFFQEIYFSAPVKPMKTCFLCLSVPFVVLKISRASVELLMKGDNLVFIDLSSDTST